jgi:hypothetical protein
MPSSPLSTINYQLSTNLEPFIFRQAGRLLATRSAQAVENTEDRDAAVNRYALRALAPEEYAAFTLDLCNNQIDRHFSRFPEEELERINELVPGRPLMERHDLRGTLPRGRFFRSALHHDGEVVSVRPEVYVLRTAENEDFILNIEGGVYRETSIGFSFRMPECSVCGKDLRTCDHVPGRTYGDSACHFIMRGVLEVAEGSVVSSGSQGTGFVREDREAPLMQSLAKARDRFHQPIELESKKLWAQE